MVGGVQHVQAHRQLLGAILGRDVIGDHGIHAAFHPRIDAGRHIHEAHAVRVHASLHEQGQHLGEGEIVGDGGKTQLTELQQRGHGLVFETEHGHG
jgi:hypothetical protein